MKKFMVKRLAQMLVVFIAVSIFSFSIIYFSPGDPLYLYTSPAKSSYKMTEEQLNDMREDLGLTGNVVERYIRWAGNMLKGDWGLSVSNHQPVKDQIMDKLPNTIGLMGAALVLSVIVAVPLGLLAGYYKNRWIDNIISGISYLGISPAGLLVWNHVDYCFFLTFRSTSKCRYAHNRSNFYNRCDSTCDFASYCLKCK